MITVVPTAHIYLCCGTTDMRRGIDSLARMVQEVLDLNPRTGAIVCFRGKKGHVVIILAYDDSGDLLPCEGPIDYHSLDHERRMECLGSISPRRS